MMFRRNLKTATVLFILCLLLFWVAASPVFALEPHEDPEAAEELFSEAAIFTYLAGAMDSMLLLNVAEVEMLFGKLQFTSVPQDMEPALSDISRSCIDLSHLLWEIDDDLSELDALASQSRLDESLQLTEEILVSLVRSGSNYNQMRQASDALAGVSGVSLAPITSDLSLSYEEILQKIVAARELIIRDIESLVKAVAPLGISLEELMEMTDTDLEEILESEGIEMEELLGMTDAELMAILESLDIDLEESQKPTEITIDVRPLNAFVGDSIHFEGTLSSETEPLAEKDVDIQVNGSTQLTVRTDSRGRYEGVLPVPYHYVPVLSLQSLYYPRGNDVGRYLASLSPLVTLEVLFHKAALGLDVADKAYPGQETTITGSFDYSDTMPPMERSIEVYLDDALVVEAVVYGSTFSQQIELAATTETGEHTITVSSAGKDRYAPVASSTSLNIVRATTVMDINLPGIIVTPGGVNLLGTLSSEVGLLSGASLIFELDKSRVEAVSTAVGDFNARLPMGMNLALVGSQDLTIDVVPQEPWNAPTRIVQQVLMINVVNVGILVVLLAVMGVYLPGRLKGRFGAFGRGAPGSVIRSPQPVLTPLYSTEVEPLVPGAEEESSQVLESRILGWYRIVDRLLRRITQVLQKPQQTLREYASEYGGALGPAAGYFTELTRIVEKVLYSRHKPTQEDAERSRHLSNTIEGVFRDEDH